MSTSSSSVRLTYWCHECDMSVSLVFSTTVTTLPLQEVLCPQCQTHFLEHMESINPDSPNLLTLQQQLTTDIDFNSLQFDYGCEGNDPSNSVASGLDNSSSVGMRMNSVEISESLSQESCAICKDEFSLHSEAKQLPCNHLYHSECILPWLSHQSSCPLCRFQLPMINPSNVVSWACSSSYFQ
ncbi:hypothetical protein AB3S75_038466 [Citrus x aurantiifolia]